MKTEYGYDFDGTRIARVTLDLNDPNCFDDLDELLSEIDPEELAEDEL